MVEFHDILAARHVHLSGAWPVDDVEVDSDDPFAEQLPTVVVANRADEIDDVAGELEVFRELTGYTYDAIITSAETGEGLDELTEWLFAHLGVVRVYTKIPHQPPDMDRPNTLR